MTSLRDRQVLSQSHLLCITVTVVNSALRSLDDTTYSFGAKHNPKGPITIAIRARYEHDTLQHATRFFVRSHTRSIRALHENQW